MKTHARRASYPSAHWHVQRAPACIQGRAAHWAQPDDGQMQIYYHAPKAARTNKHFFLLFVFYLVFLLLFGQREDVIIMWSVARVGTKDKRYTGWLWQSSRGCGRGGGGRQDGGIGPKPDERSAVTNGPHLHRVTSFGGRVVVVFTFIFIYFKPPGVSISV